jgi:hypothetical protein
LLAFDLGTCTGWALRAGDGLISSGRQRFRPRRFEGGGMRFLRFQRWLTEIAAPPATHQHPAGAGQGAIAQVVFEEVRRHTPADENQADALALPHWAIAEQGHG